MSPPLDVDVEAPPVELPESLAAEIPLPEPWRVNLLAVAEAPLACLPVKHLPVPARRTVEAMRGAGLLAGWDRRGEGLGLYVTLTTWSAACLAAALERIPHRGPRRRAIAARIRELDLTLAHEVPERWEYERPAERRGWSGNLPALAEARYQPPSILIPDEDERQDAAQEAPAAPVRRPGRCVTPGCRRETGSGQERCLKCREAALRKLVQRHETERAQERKARDRRVRTPA